MPKIPDDEPKLSESVTVPLSAEDLAFIDQDIQSYKGLGIKKTRTEIIRDHIIGAHKEAYHFIYNKPWDNPYKYLKALHQRNRYLTGQIEAHNRELILNEKALSNAYKTIEERLPVNKIRDRLFDEFYKEFNGNEETLKRITEIVTDVIH